MNKCDDIQEYVDEPHDGEVDQGIEQLRPGRAHLGSAEADEFRLGNPVAEGCDQIGAMEIAAGLAGRDEESHGRVSPPCLTEQSPDRIPPLYNDRRNLAESAKSEKAKCILERRSLAHKACEPGSC